MSNEILFKALLEFLAVVLCAVAVYNEKKLVRFERKAFKAVKCLVLAVVAVYKEEHSKKAEVVELRASKNADCATVLVKEEKSGFVKTA